MPHAIRIDAPGDADAMKIVHVDVPAPGPDEISVKHGAVGLNYIDIYHRSGLYPLPSYPAGIGLEAAGEVTAVGDGVSDVAVGERVAYASPPIGAYAEVRNLPADRVVKMPDSIDDQTAAAMMLQGMTVQYLIRRTYRVQSGDPILVHAAAGGVGLIMCQWLKHLGATVIGTVGSDEKADLAKANGCDHTILYRNEDFLEKTKEFTDGKGVAAVYDSIGADTYERSIKALRPLGTIALFGNSSGPVTQLDPSLLAAGGSLFLTRPSLMHYTASREDLVNSAEELIEVVSKGIVKISVNQTYALKDVVQAHKDLEARKTTGSTVLLP
ncbi:MAG: quinone oxidoreductase [Pseudomonadota bacterium]